MIVGRWYVQLAAVLHWYLPLCIDFLKIFIIDLKKNILSVHSFFSLFFFFFFFF